ncbi:hypothetical protein PARC_b0414 [Pseudoalteromonas arctica A 37-1-2]|uniref:Uncharacterized protein n=1 Tax=Pseudoalteromonas arctica A 37-1-2 TaxID=1117313 RepID=A0A290SAM0_9GAMM|nr:hypothetical protein PARC_b0414 [Pseudoalteromonas arctica A 37-1-2]
MVRPTLKLAGGAMILILQSLGRVDLWWVNLQQYVWLLGKAEPM